MCLHTMCSPIYIYIYIYTGLNSSCSKPIYFKQLIGAAGSCSEPQKCCMEAS